MIKVLCAISWAAIVAALLIELSPVIIPVAFILLGVSGLRNLFR